MVGFESQWTMNRKYTTLPYIEEPVATGNFDGNRQPITEIIIHTTDGTLEATLAWFNNPQSHVSAHYVIGQDGAIYAMLEEYNVAYAAGDYAVNQKSISIEHVDNKDVNGIRPDVLYSSSAKLVADICKFYGIPCDRSHVLKHSEVIATGCPDALDIDRIVTSAAKLLQSETPIVTITDQTKLETSSDGTLEWQAIKSLLDDRKNAVDNLQKELLSVKQQLTDCQNQGTQISVPSNNTSESEANISTQVEDTKLPPIKSTLYSQIIGWLNALFGNHGRTT
jgi:hypothetical protein